MKILIEEDNNNNIINNGLYICKYIKGENIVNLPINNTNLYMINKLLKEYGFEINQIRTNKLFSQEKNNSKKKIELSINQKNNLTKKHTNIGIGSFNKKEKSKIINSELNSAMKKIINNKKRKMIKSPKSFTDNKFNYKGKKLNNINEENSIPKKIVVKLNENFEDFERNYLNKIKNKNIDNI